MSAFAAIYDRSITPVDPGVLDRIMAQLEHRGPDGHDVYPSGPVAFGHWHFWTTPEEVGEKQPLRLAGWPFTIVLDGRLDNREDLIPRLGIDPTQGICLSDAALVLHAYARWGEGCLAHFIGEYAFVIMDEQNGQLLCARDALGERTLFYAWQGTRLVIASEPWAVAAADDKSPEINESLLPYYFAMRSSEDGQTFFKGIYELLPAHAMIVTSSGSRSWRYWQPDPEKRVRCRSDEAYADEFRELIEQSVRSRMRSPDPAAVMMSGGLDSTSVACLAARMLSPQTLTTISYVFDELKDCDERVFINTVEEQWGIHSIQIPSDQMWSFKDFRNWMPNPNQPHGNSYRMLVDQVYKRAQQEGYRVLLTGGTGDQLYNAGANWLADLLRDRRLREVYQETLFMVHRAGLRKTLRSVSVRRVGRSLLSSVPGGWRLHRRSLPPAWMTQAAGEALHTQGNRPVSFIQQNSGLLGNGVASSYLSEAFFANHFNVELRNPYRDRRLVEYALALPAYQLYNHGELKYILRKAMRGVLPEAIRTRRQPTSAVSLFLRGFEMEKTVLQEVVQNSKAHWRKYARADVIQDLLNRVTKSGIYTRDAMVLWSCFSYEVWKQSFIQKSHLCEVCDV